MGQHSFKKETPRRNEGCKPKPTAYEKFFEYFYLIIISFDDALTTSFFGRFNVNTPLM